MKKCLHFICPTDCLESRIKNTFHQGNYFLTTLGNSITFNKIVLRHTNSIISTIGIREVSFVLADNNRIVLDALGKQDYSDVRGLNNFYNKIIAQKEHIDMSWQTLNPQFLMLSYFLNNKIKELRNGLDETVSDRLIISGKIYNRKENIFDNIYSDLICIEDSILN